MICVYTKGVQDSPNSKYTHIKNSYSQNKIEESKTKVKTGSIDSYTSPSNLVCANEDMSQMHKVNKVTSAHIKQQTKSDQPKSQSNLDLSEVKVEKMLPSIEDSSVSTPINKPTDSELEKILGNRISLSSLEKLNIGKL